MTVLTVTSASGADDGYGGADLTFTTTEINMIAARATPRRTFYRFPLVTVPSASTINSAVFGIYRGPGQGKGNSTAMYVAAALTDDAVAPTSNAELEAIVATSPATGTISFGNSYTLIETSVTVPVTEILARSGWRSGNAIMLVTWQSADRYPNNDDNTNIVTRDDTQSAYYPYLTIDYTDGGTPPSGPEPGRFFLSP